MDVALYCKPRIAGSRKGTTFQRAKQTHSMNPVTFRKLTPCLPQSIMSEKYTGPASAVVAIAIALVVFRSRWTSKTPHTLLVRRGTRL